jgi:glycosyltransferase involved in cell wall biosynthesis
MMRQAPAPGETVRGGGRPASRPGSGAPSVVLCIPTFRRPEGLRKLLSHVARLTYAGSLSVVVVENDAELRAGAVVADEMSRAFPFPLAVIVEPRRGQTYAYNSGFARACRAASPPEYVAVLDDDEYPDRAWLTEMMRAALAVDADIVGGPVLPAFEDPHHWLARSGIYEPPRHRSGRIDMIYGAGSMLIRRSVLERYLDEPFSHAFAFTGGSDLEFFTRCRRDGRSFAWADGAFVFETTPPARASISWLLRRNFRKGGEIARIDRSFNRGMHGLARRWLRACALLSFAVLSLPFAILRGRTAVVSGLNRAARGAGRIAAEFNVVYEEYR